MTNLLNLYSDPGHLIRRAYQISSAAFFDECRLFNLGLVDCAVLYGIDSLPGTDQVSLSRAIAVDRSSIARVVSRLEARGFIKRDVNQEDRREKKVELTPEGKSVVLSIRPKVNEVNKRILAPLKPEEQEQFIRYLTTVCDLNNDISRAPLVEDTKAPK
jgi:DNA-binding MarR family transcriptional regulator